MTSWKRLRSLALGLLGVLAVLVLNIDHGHAEDGVVFSVGTYRDMHAEDRASLEFVLGAMREAVFYAQHSIGQPGDLRNADSHRRCRACRDGRRRARTSNRSLHRRNASRLCPFDGHEAT